MVESDLTPRGWLRHQATHVRTLLMQGVGLGLVAGCLTIVQMGLLSWIVSRLTMNGVLVDELLLPFMGLVLVIILRAMAQWGQESAGVEAGLRVRSRIRAELLDHLAALGPQRLSDQHSAGLGGQLVEQVEALDGYFARFLPQLRLAVLLPLLILCVVLWLDWLAALFLLLSAPLIPLFMALVGMGAERLNREQFLAVTRLAGHFLDRVRGITTLQLFNRTERSVDEVFTAADDYRQRSMRTLRIAFLSSAVLEFFASVAIAVVAIYIGFGLLGYISFGPADELTLFSGLFILLMAPEFFQPLRTLSQHYHDRAAALGAADGLVKLLKRPLPAKPSSSEATATEKVRGSRICLEGAAVSYPERGRVLGPLDLVVEPGECLAVVGPSGTGKSTLLHLLAGLVTSDEGHSEVSPASPIAWVDQRPWLVKGSLAENLRLAAPDADDERLRHAVRQAGLEVLIDTLPDGLETPLGERGLGLSGGQGQRLALARVFLSQAPLVLLDEPTASLDADTEAQVVESLRHLIDEGRTLIVATHHPALFEMADRVIRLHEGRVIDPQRRGRNEIEQ
jgi:ATP-binding cassette subfamily C protein CydD